MKKLLVPVVVAVLFLAACGHHAAFVGDRTIKLEMGMDKAKVMNVMGGDPTRTEAYLAGESVMESWYYPSGLFSHMDYVALDFKNGQLVGWGERY